MSDSSMLGAILPIFRRNCNWENANCGSLTVGTKMVVGEAEHTRGVMDFVKEHSPNEEYTQAHEQYRGFVTFQRTQGAAALALEQSNAEAAIDEVRKGLDRLKAFFSAFGAEEQMEEDGMVQHLRKIEQSL